ncbi:hypothetical protein DPMN_051360 [Dreissena polymorpha]|uniref:Uncharacterized protein n=1 Tax=Dreissena polymorpha TaxID=45954 RepID=A0A9D4HNV0_DREPO|nr:hypothetical protein DPMN_051360 [Dreissena polymorpha]
MKYGQDKEPSAMATLVGKVLPVIFPDKIVCEEGFVEKDLNQNNEPFIVVSLNGSLRSDKCLHSTEMAVELKCPVMEIHTTIPHRYMLQCESEMDALGVESLLYLCLRPDFSSVFIIRRTQELFKTAYSIEEEVYKTQNPKRVKAKSPEVKQLKVDIVDACRDTNIVE